MSVKINTTTFSVVMSVYRNDKPEYVRRAIDSITIEQTLKPDEVVIVVDGTVPVELEQLIKEYEQMPDSIFNIIWLPENKGLGNALRVGVLAANCEIIMRMDADDVSIPNRFEKQMAYMIAHPDCDILGGQMSEFIGDENNVVGKRIVPCRHLDISSKLVERCPFNHVTVAMRRSRLIEVGNYIDWHFNEDYYLWIRMALANYNFANLPDILVNVRVGKEMYQRRGGWKYFKSEAGIQNYMLKHRLISLPRWTYNVLGRFAIQVAMPNKVRGFIFQKLFREKGEQ